jgi:hypothetical protein
MLRSMSDLEVVASQPAPAQANGANVATEHIVSPQSLPPSSGPQLAARQSEISE